MLEVTAITNLKTFLELEETWNALLEESFQRENVFLRHEWFRVWWNAFGHSTTHQTLMILLVRNRGELIAIAPFMSDMGKYWGWFKLKKIQFMTNFYSSRADFIFKRDPVGVIRAILYFLDRKMGSWQNIELNYLPGNSTTVQSLQDISVEDHLCLGLRKSYQTPVVSMRSSWKNYYQDLKGHFKRNLRSREKRLSALGKISYQEYNGKGHGLKKQVLDDIFSVGSKSWKAQRGTDISSGHEVKAFYEELAKVSAQKGWLSLHLLKLGDRTIAFQYSLRYKDRLHLLKTEFDESYRKFSPGQLLQNKVLESAFNGRGINEFDFLGEAMDWKLEWNSSIYPHVDALLFNHSVYPKLIYFFEFKLKSYLKGFTKNPSWAHPRRVRTSEYSTLTNRKMP